MLITQRSESMPHPFQWEFPGGKMKPGESPERCIKREIREELHINVIVDQLLPSVVYDYGSGRIKLIPFVCIPETDNIQLQQHKDYAWITRSQLQDYDVLKADLMVVKALNGQWNS